MTDRGCEFDNQALNTIAQELGIDKKRISALHPQAIGNVERLKRTLSEMLKKSTEECGAHWDLEIPFVQFNYMTHDHIATGCSPFYLTHGCMARTPRLVLAPGPAKSPSTVPQWASTLALRLKKAHSVAAIRDLQLGERRVAVKEVDSPLCKLGDSVRMHVPLRPGLHSKLQSHWQGPFIVVKSPNVIPTTSSRPVTSANGSYDIVTSFASFAHAQYACVLAKRTAALRVPYKLQIPCILYYVYLKTARCGTRPTQMFRQKGSLRPGLTSHPERPRAVQSRVTDKSVEDYTIPNLCPLPP